MMKDGEQRQATSLVVAIISELKKDFEQDPCRFAPSLF